MCYTGTCQYESYAGHGDMKCSRGSNPCPMEGKFCPQCNSEMMESLRRGPRGCSRQEIPIWYCEKCGYQEDQ